MEDLIKIPKVLLLVAALTACVPIEDIDPGNFTIIGSWSVNYRDTFGVWGLDASPQSKIFSTHQTLYYYEDGSGDWDTEVVREDGIPHPDNTYSYPFVWTYEAGTLDMWDDDESWLSEIHSEIIVTGDTVWIPEREYMILIRK